VFVWLLLQVDGRLTRAAAAAAAVLLQVADLGDVSGATKAIPCFAQAF
jgi:hypothetical protein